MGYSLDKLAASASPAYQRYKVMDTHPFLANYWKIFYFRIF